MRTAYWDTAGAFPVLAGGTGEPCPPETGKCGPGDAAAWRPYQTRPCRHGWEKGKIGVDGILKAEMMKPNPNMKLFRGKLLGLGAALWAACLGAQPVITNQPASQLVLYGGNVTFSVMATGTGPLTYQWQCNGTNLPNNIISTTAGGNLNDGLQATNTLLGMPQDVAVDAGGNIYLADYTQNVIRKIAPNGLMTIVAGNGIVGFSGDGGYGTNASLNNPNGVVVDANGNLFINDCGNNRIRKVDTTGMITTYAGNGSLSFSGEGGQATNVGLNIPYGLALDGSGNLYIADTYNNRIRKVTPAGIISTVAGNSPSGGYSGDGGLATSANLNTPFSVAVDGGGNLYIADTYNYRIRKVTASTGKISTIAGTNTTGYTGDGGNATAATLGLIRGISLDSQTNLYISDEGYYTVRKITNGIIRTVAGTGTNGFSPDGTLATNASLAIVGRAIPDGAGNLLIPDTANNRLRKVDTTGHLSTLAGTSQPQTVSASQAVLNIPYGLAEDAAGNVYVAESANNLVRKLDTNGNLTIVAGNGYAAYSGDGGPATNASLFQPQGVAVDTNGNLFIADTYNNCIRKVGTNGIIATFAGNGNYQISSSFTGGIATSVAVTPLSVAVDNAGNLYVGDQLSHITKVSSGSIQAVANVTGNSGYIGDGNSAYFAWLTSPSAMCVDASGNLFFADTGNGRIRKISTNSAPIITSIAAGISYPQGVAVDGGGHLYLSESGANRIRRVDSLEYADQKWFTVTNATTATASNVYSVVITGSSGSVTSSVVSVSLQLPPIVPAYAAGSNALTFTWGAVSNLTYQLQWATNLSAPAWQDLGGPVTATNGSVTAVDLPGGDPQRFYRVQLVQ